MATNPTPKKSLQYYMRAIHRVLGYLAVGMVIVYALSGITLIYRMGNFMKKGTEVTTTLQPNLTPDALSSELNLRHLKVEKETDAAIIFSDGEYNKATGEVTYEKREFVTPMNKFVDLHKLPTAKNKGVGVVTTIFGVVLFLLALTSLFMFKPKNKQFKTNMIYTAIGVLLTVVLLLII